jgi:hypothetical protein
MNAEKIKELRGLVADGIGKGDVHLRMPITDAIALLDEVEALTAERDSLLADSLSLADRLADSIIRAENDIARMDYIERTFSGMTNRERYLPVQMIWGKGCNGRTLRDACDKYMTRDAARHEPKDAE